MMSPAMAEITRFLYGPMAGGVNIFVGVTRQWTEEKETQELSYEAFQSMALKEMKTLLEETSAKWPVIKACIHHRVGVVPPGEPSVIIGTATPHRNEAFESCRYLIDELKVRVPIWKKENYADGSKEWISSPSAAGNK